MIKIVLLIGLTLTPVLATVALRPKATLHRPTLRGVAVLALGAGVREADADGARELEWCLPDALARDEVPVVPPARLLAAQVHSNGAYDRAKARLFGLSVGARWVVHGTVADGAAHLSLSDVLYDRPSYQLDLPLDRLQRNCAALAERLAAALIN